MFGKRVSEYLAFEKVWLFLIAAVGLVRLGVSLAGAPDRTRPGYTWTSWCGPVPTTRGCFQSFRLPAPDLLLASPAVIM
jgi:hypothetical protein